jgi:hypothetical protein
MGLIAELNLGLSLKALKMDTQAAKKEARKT